MQKKTQMENTIRLTVHLQPLNEIENMRNVSNEQKLLGKLLSVIYWFKKKRLLPLPALKKVSTEVIDFLEQLRDDRKTSTYNNYIKKFKILEQQF